MEAHRVHRMRRSTQNAFNKCRQVVELYSLAMSCIVQRMRIYIPGRPNWWVSQPPLTSWQTVGAVVRCFHVKLQLHQITTLLAFGRAYTENV